MGCQSSKAAVQSPTLLTCAPQNQAKPPHGSAPTSGDFSAASQSNTGVSMGSSRSGALRKQTTVSLKRDDVNILVTKFTCSTKTNAKDLAWSVQASRDVSPLEINVHVDKNMILSPEVGVTCDGNQLFPNASERTKGKMLEDFRYQWPFRGTLREGMNEPRRFEMQASVGTGLKHWCPAIITKQRGDGLFEVLVDMPDTYGVMRRVNFPAVSRNDIREVGSEEPLHLSEQCLMLEVPKNDPSLAVLSVDGHAVATHFLGRMTPTVDQEEHVPYFRISDDRKHISANVGHGLLAHFLSGEVRNVATDLQRHYRSWTIQIGPFAEHNVKVTSHTWPSKVVTLTIDGEVLVEATAGDLGCTDTFWECKFHFVGEKVMKFDVFESNLDGVTLDTRGQVTHREQRLYECAVRLNGDMDFGKAEFIIDDFCFHDLPSKATLYEEGNLSLELESFLSTYGPIVPRKINRAAPTGLVGGLMAFAKEGGASDSAAAVAGLTVVRAAASDTARAGVAAAVSAAVSGVGAMGAAAIDYAPVVANAAEKSADKAGHGLSGLFAMCCALSNAEEAHEVEACAESLLQNPDAETVVAPACKL